MRALVSMETHVLVVVQGLVPPALFELLAEDLEQLARRRRLRVNPLQLERRRLVGHGPLPRLELPLQRAAGDLSTMHD